MLTRPSIASTPVLDMQQTYDMWLKKHNPGEARGRDLSVREGRSRSDAHGLRRHHGNAHPQAGPA